MNRLSMAKQVQIVSAFIEGNSVRSTCRMTGVSKGAALRLLVDLGTACAEYHDEHVRNLKVRRLQADEIWSFTGAKAKNVTPEKKAQGWGDTWTWVALDADTKLCVSYLVGGRDSGWAHEFMQDCANRISNRVQITTDGHKAYLEAVENAFGADIDYAQLQKIYGAPSDQEQRRYSPARCIGSDMKVVSGDPDPKHVSTSYVERQNLSMRMGMRRFTRLTNGFSKKAENHCHAIALYFMFYNFGRVHQTLRVTPAMESGLATHVWTIEEICSLVQPKKAVRNAATTEKEMVLKALAGPAHHPIGA
jgi:IS1 family transposase